MPNLAIVGYGKMGRMIEQFAPEYGFTVALIRDLELLVARDFQGIDVAARRDLIAAIRTGARTAATLIATSDVEEALEVADTGVDLTVISPGPLHLYSGIGRSLLLRRVAATVEVKTPVQTVHADFPHTAYRWSLGSLHYAASG